MKDIILHHSEDKACSHPLNSDESAKACEAVEIAVKKNRNYAENWSLSKKYGMHSFVGCQRIYADKPHTSLKTSAVIFYPLHLRYLKFSKQLSKTNTGWVKNASIRSGHFLLRCYQGCSRYSFITCFQNESPRSDQLIRLDLCPVFEAHYSTMTII